MLEIEVLGYVYTVRLSVVYSKGMVTGQFMPVECVPRLPSLHYSAIVWLTCRVTQIKNNVIKHQYCPWLYCLSKIIKL